MPAGDPLARHNPLAGNPLATRDDLQRAVRDLHAPLVPHTGTGGARVRLASWEASFTGAEAELEGFSRPLWGIAALAAGGGAFDHWDLVRAGLVHGTDPHHPEFWGHLRGAEQRMVEMAAIGFALAAVPEEVWDPLPGAARARLAAWLRAVDDHEPPPTNWHLFRRCVHLGLERVGEPFDAAAARRSDDAIDACYLGDGWYQDGPGGHVDHYNAWTFHSLGLVLAAHGQRRQVYMERAGAFARHYRHWFDPGGAALPFGRSLTYRFATAGYWSALVLADVDALPWAEVKARWLGNLRHWAAEPIAAHGGVLVPGYAYDNRRLLEEYSSACSPYWCMQAFLGLAAPPDHPVWAAEETPPQPRAPAARRKPVVQTAPGFVVAADAHQVVALNAGQAARPGLTEYPAKYGRFAYSTRFGWVGDVGIGGSRRNPADNMLVITDGERTRRWRTAVVDHRLDERTGAAWTRWQPFDDVVVDTVLWGGAPWHVRVHRIRTARAVVAEEGGFPLGHHQGPSPQPGESLVERVAEAGLAVVTSAYGRSLVADVALESAVARVGAVTPVAPGSALLWPHADLPLLRVELIPGEHLLACVVAASPDAAAVIPQPVPDIPAEVVALVPAV